MSEEVTSVKRARNHVSECVRIWARSLFLSWAKASLLRASHSEFIAPGLARCWDGQGVRDADADSCSSPHPLTWRSPDPAIWSRPFNLMSLWPEPRDWIPSLSRNLLLSNPHSPRLLVYTENYCYCITDCRQKISDEYTFGINYSVWSGAVFRKYICQFLCGRKNVEAPIRKNDIRTFARQRHYSRRVTQNVLYFKCTYVLSGAIERIWKYHSEKAYTNFCKTTSLLSNSDTKGLVFQMYKCPFGCDRENFEVPLWKMGKRIFAIPRPWSTL